MGGCHHIQDDARRADNLADLFTKNDTRQVCERHMTGLNCDFKSGRPEASAQLHRIKKKIASMKAFMNQDSDQEASRQDNDDKTFDWPALDYPDMESVIKYVEQRKDEEVRKAKELWSKRVSQEIMESNVGMESNNQFDVKDHWVYSRNRVSMLAVWARHHTMARSSLFTPCGTNGGSAKTVELLCTRITMGTYVDGQKFIHVDDWKDESAAHSKLEKMWTGSTFSIKQIRRTCLPEKIWSPALKRSSQTFTMIAQSEEGC